MSTLAAEGRSADLTDRGFWDRHWDVAGRRGHLRAWVRARLGMSTGPLYRFLASWIGGAPGFPPRVVELGCAPGRVLSKVQALRPDARYHGVDFSTEGLADAKQLFAELGTSAELEQADLRAYAPAKGYDVVFSCGLIEHFAEPHEIIKHHARLCLPGGRVVVTVPNFAGPVQEWAIRRLDPATLETHNLSIMRTDQLAETLSSAGLTGVQAGSFGRATIRAERLTKGAGPRLIEASARAWNEFTRVTPRGVLPGHYLWATGVAEAA